jgi:hypothetical protein
VEDLVKGTLADRWTLMTHPPRLRPGHTSLVYGVQPAAGANYTYAIGNSWWERILCFAFTLTTASSGSLRQVALNYQDNNGATFDQVVCGLNLGNSRTFTVYADQQGPTPGQYPASQVAYGTQTSPAAGTTIASIGSLPPGVYTASWTAELSGTLTAGTDNDNFGLYVGGSLVQQSVNLAVAGDYPQQEQDFEIGVAATVAVKNINAATSGADYAASLVITPQQVLGVQAQLPDLILKSGWQVALQITNLQAADQISGVYVLTEQYASNYAGGQLFADAEREETELFRRLEVTG